MKQKYNLVIYLAIIFGLSSCARGCVGCQRNIQFGSRHYHIEQYSGGKVINTFEVYGIINNQQSSDGCYWYQGDTLVEVQGPVYIKSWK